MKTDDIAGFRTALLRDIVDDIHPDKGGIREEEFTKVALDYLEDAGDTEGAVPCREIRENSIGKRVHKINGYALSESHETIDLFITEFRGSDEIGRLYSEEIKTAFNLSTRFLQNVFSNKMEGIEETAPVFDFVRTIQKIGSDIVRVNIYILSDMLIPGDLPEPPEFGDIKLSYHVRDIEYLYRIQISGTGKQAISIDFEKNFDQVIECLALPEKNEDYDSYLCIMPARILADIYQEHGARLLEQNVRTFLQFRGDINKGIRDTILNEPHMFMAYNNGISATAEGVQLSDDGKSIISVTDFQIVNGGQTTASIFQTRRKYKMVNIGAVSVQVKLSVIKNTKKRAQIVSLISKYANTQNKVSEADLSSNHPFHIELEQLSRKIWAPAISGSRQTRWFYERARGQYNDELSQIESKSKQKKWLVRNPKNQKFAKEDLARFYISWEMEPSWVVRGRQRTFAQFMKRADNLEATPVFFEELIAKAILFRTAERLYGAGAKAIGDLRYMVVPYTIAWLNLVTDGRIDLRKIWQQQKVSPEFEAFIYDKLNKVDRFMRNTAPGGLIGEWAKKDDCWKQLKKTDLGKDFSLLKKELYSEARPGGEEHTASLNTERKQLLEKRIRALGIEGLVKLEQKGRATSGLDIRDSGLIMKVIRKIERKKEFTDKELLEIDRILNAQP